MSRERDGDLDRFDDDGQEGPVERAWRLRQRRIVLEVALKHLKETQPDHPTEEQDVAWTGVIEDIEIELLGIKELDSLYEKKR